MALKEDVDLQTEVCGNSQRLDRPGVLPEFPVHGPGKQPGPITTNARDCIATDFAVNEIANRGGGGRRDRRLRSAQLQTTC